MKTRSVPLLPRLTAKDREAHQAFIAELGTNAIWHDYLDASAEFTARIATA
jgi:hypothetical protein